MKTCLCDKIDSPIRDDHVYKETWIPQKDDILHYIKEALNIDKYTVSIWKENRLVEYEFMTGNPMNCES